MSRLDYFTIGVVAVCIMAIVFLLYQTTDLFNFGKDTPQESITTEDNSSLENDFYDDEEIADYEDYYEDETTPTTTEEADYDNGQNATEEPIETYEETTTTATQPKQQELVDIDTPSPGGDFLVLAGSFEYKHNAQVQAKKIQNLGYSKAEVVSFNRGKYASVLVNRFETEAEARALVDKLRKDGVSSYVHKKR